MNESDKWIVRPSAAQGYLILKPAPNGISLHQLIGRVVKEEDANLVAVAPELKETLQELVSEIASSRVGHCQIGRIYSPQISVKTIERCCELLKRAKGGA